MTLNKESLDLIKEFEGLRLTAYRCPAGVLTIGYGHTSAAGAPVVKPGMKITEAEAEAILRRDLRKYEVAVDSAVLGPMTHNQRGALVSLCYNIGSVAFRRSTAVRRMSAGNYAGAAEALTWFNKANGRVLRGLVRRREAERALFLKDAADDFEAEEASPDAPITGGEAKPMAHSKTVGLGGLTLASALAMITDIREAVPEVGEYLPYALAVIGALIIVNRFIEAWKGEH